MQKIKEIRQKKRGIYELFTDEDAFLISESMLIDYHLYKDALISEEIIAEIKQKIEHELCYQKALQLLARRDHFISELNYKLIQRSYLETSINTVIERLKTEKLINQREFARRLIVEKADLYSRVKLRNYLLNKGCPKGIADDLIADILIDDESEKAYQYLSKKYKRIEISQLKRDKALRMLANQGFSYKDANKAYNKFTENV